LGIKEPERAILEWRFSIFGWELRRAITATTLEEKLDPPLLFPGLTWEQFKTLEPMLDIPGVRLSFLDRILEIQ
jgi:hypothetical protein